MKRKSRHSIFRKKESQNFKILTQTRSGQSLNGLDGKPTIRTASNTCNWFQKKIKKWNSRFHTIWLYFATMKFSSPSDQHRSKLLKWEATIFIVVRRCESQCNTITERGYGSYIPTYSQIPWTQCKKCVLKILCCQWEIVRQYTVQFELHLLWLVHPPLQFLHAHIHHQTMIIFTEYYQDIWFTFIR